MGAESLEFQPRTVVNRVFDAITDIPIVNSGGSDLEDNELVLGVVINGEATGRFLTPVPAIVSGLVPWVTFHPETEGLTEAAWVATVTRFRVCWDLMGLNDPNEFAGSMLYLFGAGSW